MRIAKKSTKRTLGVALAAAMTLGATVAVAGSSEAAVAKLVITPSSGSAGIAGKVLTLVGSGFKVGSAVKVGQISDSGVQFQTAACNTSAPLAASSQTVVEAATRVVPTASKIIITTPSGLGTTADTTSKKWNVCVYALTANGTTAGALIGSGTYTTLGAPTISEAIAPVSGPAAGGGTVTIPVTNVGKTPKVYFGTALSPKVTVATGGLSLDAVVPAHAPGDVTVSIVTDGGTNPDPATGTWDDYTYKNAISVEDNTGLGSGTNDISITGVGFNDLNFIGSTSYVTPATAAHPASAVFLTAGAYNPAGTASTFTALTAPKYTCGSVTVVSDTELTCTVPTATDGAYTVVVVNDSRVLDTTVVGADTAVTVNAAGDLPTLNASVVSSSATYTVAAF